MKLTASSFRNLINLQNHRVDQNTSIHSQTQNIKHTPKQRLQLSNAKEQNSDVSWLENIVKQFSTYEHELNSNNKYLRDQGKSGDRFCDDYFARNNISDDELFPKQQGGSKLRPRLKSERKQRQEEIFQQKKNSVKSKQKQLKYQALKNNLTFGKSCKNANAIAKQIESRKQYQNVKINREQSRNIEKKQSTDKIMSAKRNLDAASKQKYLPKQGQSSQLKIVATDKKLFAKPSQTFQPTTQMQITTDLAKIKQKLSIENKPNNNRKVSTKNLQNFNKNTSKNHNMNIIINESCSNKTNTKPTSTRPKPSVEKIQCILQPSIALSEAKPGIGKIIRNKSVEMKQNERNIRSVETLKNNAFGTERVQTNQIQNLLSKQRRQRLLKKQQNNMNREQHDRCFSEQHSYIVKQFKQQSSEVKQQSLQKQDSKQKQNQEKKGIPLQQSCQKLPGYLGKDQQNKQAEFREHSQNKKYNYLDMQNRLDKIINKKQKRLNSSFGERKFLHYDYLAFKGDIDKKYNNNPKIKFDSDQAKSSISPNPNTRSNPHSSTTIGLKAEANLPSTQNTAIHQRVKQVQSAVSSQIIQHSIVLQREKLSNEKDSNLFAIQNPQQQHRKPDKQEQGKQNEQWNILKIFDNLDRKKTGILNADNCGIKSVSREIRYILGPVLQQVLYCGNKYDFTAFVNRVETILQNVTQSKLPLYQPQSYLKTKQAVGQTHRFHPLPAYPSSRQSNIAQSSLSSTIGQAKSYPNLPSSYSGKKYSYQTNFVVDNISTQPSPQISYNQRNRNRNEFSQKIAFKPSYSQSKSIQSQQFQSQKLGQKIQRITTYRGNEMLASDSQKSEIKLLRFATFQDEDSQPSQQQKQNMYSKYLGTGQYRNAYHNQHKILEQNLSQLNQFKVIGIPFGSRRHKEIQNQRNMQIQLRQLSRQAPPFDKSRQKIGAVHSSRPRHCNQKSEPTNSRNCQQSQNKMHKNQMAKLEILNDRLERYLYDQNMKEFSTSKLVIENI